MFQRYVALRSQCESTFSYKSKACISETMGAPELKFGDGPFRFLTTLRVKKQLADLRFISMCTVTCMSVYTAQYYLNSYIVTYAVLVYYCIL